MRIWEKTTKRMAKAGKPMKTVKLQGCGYERIKAEKKKSVWEFSCLNGTQQVVKCKL